MAASEAEIQGQLQAAANWFQKLYLQASVSSPNQVGLEDTLAQAIEGVYTPDSLASLRSLARRSLSSALSPSAVKSVLWPIIKEYGTTIYNISPQLGQLAFLRELHKNWADQGTPVTFKRRNPTLGAASAGGSNTGTGTINRLTTDWRGYTMQTGHVEVKNAVCVRDQSSGSPAHEEEFEFRGYKAPLDNLELGGSGLVKRIRSASARTSEAFVSNPSFTNWTGTNNTNFSATTDLTDWTLSTAASFQPTSDSTYRSYEGEGTTGYALRFNTNANITQALTTRRASFDYYTPYYCQIAWKAESSCDGTLTLAFGGVSANVSVTGSSWTILRIAIGSNSWPRQFIASSSAITITLASRTTGTLLVDDLIVAPMVEFDGAWFLPVGGATRFKVDDYFTFTDSIASDAVIARWIAWAFGFSVPTASSPVIADPS